MLLNSLKSFLHTLSAISFIHSVKVWNWPFEFLLLSILLTSLCADSGQKVSNIYKFVKDRVLEQISSNERQTRAKTSFTILMYRILQNVSYKRHKTF